MVMFPHSILKVGDIYYMYGEWCFSDENSGENAIRCYSSKDLSHWKFEANVLTQDDSHLINIGSMVYCEKTRKYVYCYKYRRPMWFPGWEKGDGILAWATSSSPTGRFTIANKDPRVGIVAGEVTIFIDTDKKAYAVADNSTLDRKMNIYALSDDYCSIVSTVCDLGWSDKTDNENYEAGTIFKINGTYYIISIDFCNTNNIISEGSWDGGGQLYRMATNLSGPWSQWKLLPLKPSLYYFPVQFEGMIYEVSGGTTF